VWSENERETETRKQHSQSFENFDNTTFVKSCIDCISTETTEQIEVRFLQRRREVVLFFSCFCFRRGVTEAENDNDDEDEVENDEEGRGGGDESK
jgi:hypothetical protein